jgi:drug/metabolite transporter (DMT)-like permease
MFSYALKRTSATTVSVLILLEVPGAALIAWWWLGQVPRAGTVPALVLLLIGVAVAVLGAGARRARAGAPLADVADPEPR